MKHTPALNTLMLSCLLTLVPTPMHGSWSTCIKDYFNKPTQNALIITTAVAGTAILATFACAWSWWKSHWNIASKNAQEMRAKDQKILSASYLENLASQTALAHEKEVGELRKDNKKLKALLAYTGKQKNTCSILQNRLQRLKQANSNLKNRLSRLKSECVPEYRTPLSPEGDEPDSPRFSSAGCELLAPPSLPGLPYEALCAVGTSCA